MIIRETSEHLPLKKLGFWHSIFNIVVEISDVPNMEHKHNIMLNWLLVEFIPPNLYIMIGKVKMDGSLFFVAPETTATTTTNTSQLSPKTSPLHKKTGSGWNSTYTV